MWAIVGPERRSRPRVLDLLVASTLLMMQTSLSGAYSAPMAGADGTTDAWGAQGAPPTPNLQSERAAVSAVIMGEPHADPKVVIIEGQVTNHIGGGERHVSVSVHAVGQDGDKGELISTAVTDQIGDFKVTSTSYIEGDVIVILSKPDYADTVRRLHLSRDKSPPFIAVQLEGELVLSGGVSDALTGLPVPAASVKLSSFFREWLATTDDKGRFTITGVTPGAGELVVEAGGYGREIVDIPDIGDMGESAVTLKPERIVHIRVVDENGNPVAGATVEVHDGPRDDFRTLVTVSDGAVTLRGVHFDATTLALRLTHRDHVSPGTFSESIALPADILDSTHTVAMRRAGHIVGLVTGAASGKALNGARVMADGGYSGRSPRDWTDYLGRYALTGVIPGTTIVTVHLSGFAPDLKTAEVTAGGEAKLDFELVAAAAVTGVVRKATGEPVSGAYVEATRWRGAHTLGLRAVTAEDGRFVIDGAPRDEFEITVYGPDGATARRTIVARTGEVIDIILQRSPSPSEVTQASPVKAGDQAPAITVTTDKGRRIELANPEGKTVLLDFWATWCGPCVDELPVLSKVYAQGKEHDDFLLIGVSLDGDERQVRRFLDKHEIDWHQVYGSESGALEAAGRFGVVGLPAVFLIGADGKVISTGLRGHEIYDAVTRVWQEQVRK
ncbi:MAG: carboxypeptidase regulatory-like domain-containing protein [Phycisphaerae bacterium]